VPPSDWRKANCRRTAQPDRRLLTKIRIITKALQDERDDQGCLILEMPRQIPVDPRGKPVELEAGMIVWIED
jgi:hypothetical protein